MTVEAQVTYEDGRTGTIRAEVGSTPGVPRWPPVTRDRPARLLEVDGISVRFGALLALNRVSLDDPARARSPPSSGPTAPARRRCSTCISGFYHPYEGRIRFAGHDRTHLRPPDVAALGIARTFQNVALFQGMSVLDNIMTGRLMKMRGSFLLDAVWWGPARRQELEHRAFVERIIDFLEIQAIRKTPAGRLPYGLQKRVELARALAAEPQLLLLDEPMAGMNVEEKEDMCRFILDVNGEFGTTIALIEHDMGVVMDISDRVVVLDYGRKIADGPPDAGPQGRGRARRLPRRRPRREVGLTVDAVAAVLVAPFKDMAGSPAFLVEVLLGGIAAGLMYSLVALGFVLIFKASGVFNFAQGVMVLFAALTLVGLIERGVPVLVALVLTTGGDDRAGLRHRAAGAAPARQPGAHHPVHGHHRAELLPGGVRRDGVGRQRQAARRRHPRQVLHGRRASRSTSSS